MALIDDIKARLATVKQQQAQGDGQQAAKLLRTKATGKATQATGPQASNIGEQAAVQEGQQQLQQVGQQGQLAAAQLGQQQQGIELAKQQQDVAARTARADITQQNVLNAERREAQTQQFNMKLSSEENQRLAAMSSQANQAMNRLASQRRVAEEDIFESFRQGNESIYAREDAAELQQASFLMELQNRQHIDTIVEIGNTRQLQDSAAFKEEVASLQFENDLEMLKDNQEWQAAYNADVRQWSEAMNDMSFDSALQISRNQIESENTVATMQGVEKATGAGIDHYQQQKAKQPTKQQGDNSSGS